MGILNIAKNLLLHRSATVSSVSSNSNSSYASSGSLASSLSRHSSLSRSLSRAGPLGRTSSDLKVQHALKKSLTKQNGVSANRLRSAKSLPASVTPSRSMPMVAGMPAYPGLAIPSSFEQHDGVKSIPVEPLACVDNPDGCAIYVSNIPSHVTETMLYELFERCGPVVSVEFRSAGGIAEKIRESDNINKLVYAVVLFRNISGPVFAMKMNAFMLEICTCPTMLPKVVETVSGKRHDEIDPVQVLQGLATKTGHWVSEFSTPLELV